MLGKEKGFGDDEFVCDNYDINIKLCSLIPTFKCWVKFILISI